MKSNTINMKIKPTTLIRVDNNDNHYEQQTLYESQELYKMSHIQKGDQCVRWYFEAHGCMVTFGY